MDPLFAWIEGSALSQWICGSECICAFPAIVTLHNIGLAFLAGGGIVIDLRLIGFASDMPLRPMARFSPVLWLAFLINATTGVLLLIAYPTKALTNPLFYIKMSVLALALTWYTASSPRCCARRRLMAASPPRTPGCSPPSRSRPGSPSSPPGAFSPTRTRGSCSASPPSCNASESVPWI